MKISKISLVFFILLLVIACTGKRITITEEEKQVIYAKKGFNTMKRRLEPEIIKTNKAILAITALNLKNTLGALNKDGEFSLLTIDNDGIIDIQVILPGQPEKKSYDLQSDDENNIMWVVRGRGVYFIDLETKKTGHAIASNDGNGKIYTVFTANSKEKIMGIVYTNCPGCSTNLYLYDLLNQKLLNELYIVSGDIFPYYDNKILTCFYGKKDDKRTIEWNFYGYFAVGPDDLYSDKLTEELTKTKMQTWQRSKTIHLGRRMLLCSVILNEELIYFSVRWDEEREDIKIEPLILQRPKNMYLDSAFVFSQRGDWVKTMLTHEGDTELPPELAIFHTGDMYPQGLSLPILCGYTKENGFGGFMDHETWGPCYVELDSDFPDKLFVYKLNDGLKMLAEEALRNVTK